MEGGGKRTEKHGARFFLIVFLSPSVRPSDRPSVRPVRRCVPLRWCRLCVIVLYSPQRKHARGRTNGRGRTDGRTERSPNRSRSLDFGSFGKRLSNTHQRTPRTYGAWRSCAHGYSSQWHTTPVGEGKYGFWHSTQKGVQPVSYCWWNNLALSINNGPNLSA